MSFGNLTLLLCKTCGVIFYCFVHQHGRLITWMQTKNWQLIQLTLLRNDWNQQQKFPKDLWIIFIIIFRYLWWLTFKLRFYSQVSQTEGEWIHNRRNYKDFSQKFGREIKKYNSQNLLIKRLFLLLWCAACFGSLAALTRSHLIGDHPNP